MNQISALGNHVADSGKHFFKSVGSLWNNIKVTRAEWGTNKGKDYERNKERIKAIALKAFAILGVMSGISLIGAGAAGVVFGQVEFIAAGAALLYGSYELTIMADNMFNSTAKSFIGNLADGNVKQALEEGGKALNEGLDGLADGIEEAGREAYNSITQGFNNFFSGREEPGPTDPSPSREDQVRAAAADQFGDTLDYIADQDYTEHTLLAGPFINACGRAATWLRA